MIEAGRPTPALRQKALWTLAIAVLSAVAVASAEVHGRASRLVFEPPPELDGARTAMVGTAADAFRVWRAAGMRGRRVIVLSGQWSKPTGASRHPGTAGQEAGPAADDEVLDARTALFAAARVGIGRGFDVVMPPAAFARRLAEVRGSKELLRGDGTFRLAYHGLDRRFSAPRAFVGPDETALVLVEPSWFEDGAPSDPLEWLASRGVRWDLALIALDDPGATEVTRRAASAFGERVGARFLDTE